MPDATITSTASTFGSISGTFAADQSMVAGTVYAITGTVNGSVGVPGPQGPAGSQGQQGVPGDPGAPGVGVPTGGTAGQFLTKIDGTNYNTDWTTINLSAYLLKSGGTITGDIQSNNNSAYRSWDGAYNSTVLKGDYLQLTNSNIGGNALTVEWNGITFPSGKQTVHYPGAGILSGYATESWVTAGFYPLTGNPSGFITSSALSPYLLSATAASTYAVIAAGQPTSGTVGQVLTKNSGTNYDSSWATLIPGDRYLTTSTTSNTISNGAKTFTVGTGLSYSSQQDVVIAYDASNHMHALVTSYNSGTGVLVVDVQHHTGSGTYSSWTVNVGGTTPLQSVEWGEILGTLGDQSDLANALNDKLELSGGVLDANATIEASTATQLAVFGGSGLNVELTANPSENSVLGYGGLQVQNFSGTMAVTPSGLTFPNASTQTVAYPGSTGFLLKADNLSGLADTAVSRTNLGLGTMATATAADYLTVSAAAAGYYPLTGNPSSFLTASALTGYATESFVTSQGYINDAPSDGSQYARQDGAWEVVTGGGGGSWGSITGTLSDQTDLVTELNGKANLSGDTFTGFVIAPPPTSTGFVDNVVINRQFSEQFLGFNWADLISTKVNNISFSVSGSDPESPIESEQSITFDFCCPEGLNNLKSLDGNYPNVIFGIYLSGVQQTSWNVSSSPINSTANTRTLNASFAYGNFYEVFAEITLGIGLPQQKSRFKIGQFSV